MTRKRVLFAGYAPVHFVCFLPVYRRLAADPAIELWLTGGFKHEDDSGVRFALEGFYDPFAVDRSRVITAERARDEDFDVLVCSHLSDAIVPRTARRSVQIFHGVSFKNLAVREKALNFDVLCLPGRYHAEAYRTAGLIRADGPRYLLTGFAKDDPLVDGSLDRDALLRRLELDPSRPTLLFAPTGEKHNALETMGVDVISALAANPDWNLLIKPHDHPKHQIDWFETLAPLESDRVRLVRELDVVPYLHAADLLLSDASSVAVEYTLLDRPIVFLDVPRLFEKVQKRAPAMDLETYGRRIGAVATAADVVARVRDGLAHPDRERELRRAMARHVFWDPGRAAERVAGVVRHAAGLIDALPLGVEEVR